MTRTIHVLIVEDDKDTAWSLKRLLEVRTEVTFTTETAQDLASAVVRLESGRVDAVLLDMHLPDAPAGPELVRIIKAVAPDVGVIVLTGWDGADLEMRVREAGADDYLTKPPEPGDVSRRLRHSVIYRRSEQERHEIEAVLDKLGPAMEQAVRITGDSGMFEFPKSERKDGGA
jgi:DNA-binding response OmpR family regulator